MKKYLVSLLLMLPFLLMAKTITSSSWKYNSITTLHLKELLVTQQGDTLVNYQPQNPFEFYSTIVKQIQVKLTYIIRFWGDDLGGHKTITQAAH